METINGVFRMTLLLLYVIFVALPYFWYGNVRDGVLRTVYTDRIWLLEQNPEITWGADQRNPIEPPHTMSRYTGGYGYAEVHTMTEARDWLVEHGYKVTELTPSSPDMSADNKYFPVKKLPQYDAYSIICIAVDYGDGDVHLIPYRYEKDDSPFDFDSMPKLGYRTHQYISPLLPWMSTHNTGSHMFGGHHMQEMRSDEDLRIIEQRIERRMEYHVNSE